MGVPRNCGARLFMFQLLRIDGQPAGIRRETSRDEAKQLNAELKKLGRWARWKEEKNDCSIRTGEPCD